MNAFIKKIIAEHFIQIVLGCIFYFYYVGYASCVLSTKDIFLQSYWLIESPNIKGIVFLGFLGFLAFNWLMLSYLFIYEILRFIYQKFNKYRKWNVTLFQVVVVLIVGLIFLIVRLDYIIIPVMFFLALCVFNIDSEYKLISSSLSFKYLQGILICIYLIFFPVVATKSTIVGLQGGVLDEYMNSNLNVVTKIPLGLKGEIKNKLGYVNKLQLLNIKDNIAKFLIQETDNL